MKIGDILTVSYDNLSQSLIILSYEDRIINGFAYTIYYLSDEHTLYVKNNFAVSNPLDIKGHLITAENKIQGDSYYLKINGECALPC